MKTQQILSDPQHAINAKLELAFHRSAAHKVASRLTSANRRPGRRRRFDLQRISNATTSIFERLMNDAYDGRCRRLKAYRPEEKEYKIQEPLRWDLNSSRYLQEYLYALNDAMRNLTILQDLQRDIDYGNAFISELMRRTQMVYRGCKVHELEAIVRHCGRIGHHYRDSYCDKMDFASTSLEPWVGDAFSRRHGGIRVQYDISGMDDSEKLPVIYKTMPDIRFSSVWCEKRPWEYFGGIHSGKFIREAEVRLLKGSRPRMVAILVESENDRSLVTSILPDLENVNGSRIQIVASICRMSF